MAEVSRTESGEDVMSFHEIPDLMTRVRMEHKLEALHRDRSKIELAIKQIHLSAERSMRPPHKPLLELKKKEVADLTEEMESIIRDLNALNEGINPEKDKDPE